MLPTMAHPCAFAPNQLMARSPAGSRNAPGPSPPPRAPWRPASNGKSSSSLARSPPGSRNAPGPSPPPRAPWRPASNGKSSSSQSQGSIIAGLVIAFVAALLLFTIVCSICKGYRNSRARTAAAARAAARTSWPPPEQRTRVDDGRQIGRASGAGTPTAQLPAFTYSRSVKHNVTGGGEEAATCSVCLGAFHLGETVRLLPACLHLYHVECIDPWLDAHSTCPLCRSDTDPDMDVAPISPV